MKKENLPKKLAVFPLSNFIIFPKTTVPLNIFEPRYIDMINDSMKSDKMIGMIQPRIIKNEKNSNPDLYKIGCMGKITSFKETDDKRFLIEIKGLIRFQIESEIPIQIKNIVNMKLILKNFYDDLLEKKEEIKFSDSRTYI